MRIPYLLPFQRCQEQAAAGLTEWRVACSLRGRDAFTNTVETERYREILRKELRVTDRQMKEQAVQKLKEYGKEIGFSFDISKKKSQFGRMQGEKWQDEELDVWKHQASRLLSTPEPITKKLAR